MKKWTSAIVAAWFLPSFLWAVQTPIYPIFTDNGIAGEDLFTWGSISISTAAASPVPPEGLVSVQTANGGVFGGWGVVFLNPDKTKRGVDLSAYAAAGQIRFWAYCTTDNFIIDIEDHDNGEGIGSKDEWNFNGAFGGQFNQWVPVELPLNQVSFPINNVFSPFEITLNQAGTCFIDDVRYVNPPAPDADIFGVTVKTVATQSPAPGGFSWPSGVQPTGWAVSNQYIELQIDNLQDLSWGVQIYTNNTSGGASPKYTGPASTNPAGLVDTASPSTAIPLAWSIKSSTQSPAAWLPPPSEPNNTSDPNSFQWLYMKDAATPNIPAQNTTAFFNGDSFVTAKNNVGIHFAQSPTEFGPATPPNYIFLEANFGAGMAARTYQTNELTVEYFSL